MRWEPLRNASPLAERFPFRLGVSVEMPGAVSLRPALTPGLRRESATSFRLTIGTEVLARSAALRCGVPGFTVERVCIVEVSTLRRPSGACRRDAACAVVFRFF